jgi:hypothetical protein
MALLYKEELYRFVRDTAHRGNYWDPYRYRLCRYRLNLSKKGKVLWKLAEIVADGFERYSTHRGAVMYKEKDITDNLQTELHYDKVVEVLQSLRCFINRSDEGIQRSVDWLKSNDKKVILREIWFKEIRETELADTINNLPGQRGVSIFNREIKGGPVLWSTRYGALYWIPVGPALAICPPDMRIDTGMNGVHNVEATDISVLSAHERLRLMESLRKKTWITKRKKSLKSTDSSTTPSDQERKPYDAIYQERPVTVR